MAKDIGFHLGETQEQEVEEDHQGTAIVDEDPQPHRVSIEERAAQHPLQLQVRSLSVQVVRWVQLLRRWGGPWRSQ
jgi:hypothetical protein